MNKPLRVLVLGKINTIHTQRFVKELQRQGIEVGVVSFSPCAYASTNVQLFVPKSNPPRIFGLPKTALLGVVLFLNQVIQKFRPHVIHIQHDLYYLNYLRWIINRAPLIAYSAWGHYSPEEKTSVAFQKGLANVNLLVSDAPDILDEIAIMSPSAISGIVRFGADIDLFSPGEPDYKILEMYGIGRSGAYIFSPRSLRENYNQVTIVQALPEIIQQFPDIRLILKHHHPTNYSDSTSYQKEIRGLAESLGVWEYIVRIDHIPYEHLVHLYRISRLTVSIPLEDGLPATIFEAMATGCPLVVSQDRSYEGVIQDGYNAFCVPAQDAKRVASAATKVLTNPSLSTDLSKNGLQTVKDKGDFCKEIALLINLYEAALVKQTQR